MNSEYSSRTVENTNFSYCSNEFPDQVLETLSELNERSNFPKLDETTKNEKNTFVLTKNPPKNLLICQVVAENGNIPHQHFTIYFTRLCWYFLIFGQ